MKRMLWLTMAVVLGCRLPTGTEGPALHPHIEFAKVDVSPDTVHAGSSFNISASITYGDCASPAILVSYDPAKNAAYQPGTSIQSSFTAVLTQTSVNFFANCYPVGGGSVEAAFATVDISVDVIP
jgi:hypothetical protein